MTLIFDPSRSSKVKCDGGNRKPVCPATKCYLGFNLISVTVFEIFRVKVLTVHLLTLIGLTPEPRSPKEEMTYSALRSTFLQNFSPITQTVCEICVTKIFQFLA